MGCGISTTVEQSFDETVTAVRAALADQGFGVLTEIDMAATLKKKLDVDDAAQRLRLAIESIESPAWGTQGRERPA